MHKNKKRETENKSNLKEALRTSTAVTFISSRFYFYLFFT